MNTVNFTVILEVILSRCNSELWKKQQHVQQVGKRNIRVIESPTNLSDFLSDMVRSVDQFARRSDFTRR